MKLIVEMDINESYLAIRNGTLTALIDSLSTPRMQITTNGAQLSTPTPPQTAPAAPQTAPAAEKVTGIDFAKAAADAAAKAAAREAKAAEKAAKEAATEKTVATDTAASAEECTLEQVRSVLAGINKAGKAGEVKALLAEFGAAKLTEIDKADYPALLAKAATL